MDSIHFEYVQAEGKKIEEYFYQNPIDDFGDVLFPSIVCLHLNLGYIAT